MIANRPSIPDNAMRDGDYRLAGAGPAAVQRGLIALAVACLAFSFIGIRRGNAQHFMMAYLTSFAFYLSISLGALFFVMLHHLTGAKWSIVLRRLAEGLAMLLPLCLALFIPILGWLPQVYAWAGKGTKTPQVQAKAAYLNEAFFTVRGLVYFAVWIGLAAVLWRISVRQDEWGKGEGESHAGRADEGVRGPRRISGPGMLLFAVTITFAAFDWFMSLDATWYSTIFGVYYFSGAAVAIYAALILVALALTASGRLAGAVTVEHFHDLGKLLFAFVVFWAYIAFSQLLLIWMGNIPEETAWYARRWNPPFWRAVSLVLLGGHFILPFLFLLPRTVKRARPLLGAAAAWMLLMHAVDCFWLIFPAMETRGMPVRPTDAALFIGMGALYGAVYLMVLQRRPLVPVGDPRLAESIVFENP